MVKAFQIVLIVVFAVSWIVFLGENKLEYKDKTAFVMEISGALFLVSLVLEKIVTKI